jgi:hypothetical protein
MYLLYKTNGSHTVVVTRDTMESAIVSLKAFAETYDLELEIDGTKITATDGTRFPEIKGWIELQPYKQVELCKN